MIGRYPWRAVIAGVALVLLSGCAFPGGAGSTDDERALAPATAPANRAFQQVLTLVRGGNEHRLIAAGRICNGTVDLSLLTAEGMEVLRLRQDDDGLAVDHRRALPRAVTGRAIMADFQLIHWPAASLREAWGETRRLRVSERERRVVYRGTSRVRVRYAERPWHGEVTLENRTFGYRLRVKTVEQHRLAATCTRRPGA